MPPQATVFNCLPFILILVGWLLRRIVRVMAYHNDEIALIAQLHSPSWNDHIAFIQNNHFPLIRMMTSPDWDLGWSSSHTQPLKHQVIISHHNRRKMQSRHNVICMRRSKSLFVSVDQTIFHICRSNSLFICANHTLSSLLHLHF